MAVGRAEHEEKEDQTGRQPDKDDGRDSNRSPIGSREAQPLLFSQSAATVGTRDLPTAHLFAARRAFHPRRVSRQLLHQPNHFASRECRNVNSPIFDLGMVSHVARGGCLRVGHRNGKRQAAPPAVRVAFRLEVMRSDPGIASWTTKIKHVDKPLSSQAEWTQPDGSGISSTAGLRRASRPAVGLGRNAAVRELRPVTRLNDGTLKTDHFVNATRFAQTARPAGRLDNCTSSLSNRDRP